MITTMSENNGHGASGTKRLYRRRDGRLVAGVCAGVADYFGVDVTLVRLAFAVFTIFWGLGALLYLAAWAVIPEEGQKASIVENVINKQRRASHQPIRARRRLNGARAGAAGEGPRRPPG